MREANECWEGRPERLYEVHPEVLFLHMAGAPFPYAKTSWDGLNLRRRLLRDHGIEVPDELGQAGLAAPDDALDAAAAAWSAYRIATGNALTYPDPPQPMSAIT